MDFFDKTGKMAIGSRLRLLTDQQMLPIYTVCTETISNRNGFRFSLCWWVARQRPSRPLPTKSDIHTPR